MLKKCTQQKEKLILLDFLQIDFFVHCSFNKLLRNVVFSDLLIASEQKNNL